MFGAGALAFREFVMREPLPLATIQHAVLEFLRGRDDAVVFGAQAVRAYVNEPRMTQDLDLLSPRAAELANMDQQLFQAEVIMFRCHVCGSTEAKEDFVDEVFQIDHKHEELVKTHRPGRLCVKRIHKFKF